MRWIALMAAIGLTACNQPVSDAGICAGMKRPVAALRGALVAHGADTPDAVGEAGADVVLGLEAGCR